MNTTTNSEYKWECVDKTYEDILNITHIHPTRQRVVGKIVNYIKTLDTINSVSVFGSSALPRCNYGSDVDLYIDGEIDVLAMYEALGDIEFDLDIVKREIVDKRLLQEIEKKGVVVYARE